jgi:DNA-directed RNA polymerase subunit E'/Rpb7
MFYHIKMSTELILEPQYLGPQFRARIHAQLYREVGSQCTGRHGFVVTVTRVRDLCRFVFRWFCLSDTRAMGCSPKKR